MAEHSSDAVNTADIFLRGPENITESLWTVEETAQYLKLNSETIRSMARRGDLPARKIGKVWRFDPSKIRALHV